MKTALAYTEVAISSLALTIASTHFHIPPRDGQAELTWVTGYILRWSGLKVSTFIYRHLQGNPDQ